MSVSPPTSSAFQLLGTTHLAAYAFQIDPNRRYIVKNLLLGGQVSMLCGAPNTGKSSVFACIASHVAVGRDFGSMKVRRGLVVDVAAEEPVGIQERASPYMGAASTATASYFVRPQSIDLTDPVQTKRFGDDLNAL